MQAQIFATKSGYFRPSASVRQAALGSSLESYFAIPEMRLLLACCRKELGTLADGQLADVVAEPFDETVFMELCRRHRLIILARKTLMRPHGSMFSGDMVSWFDREAMRLAQAQLRSQRTMLDVHRAFREGRVRHIFLKGPLLGTLLSGSELLRYSNDLDILIESGNLLEADARLRGLGFRPPDGILRLPLLRVRRKDISYRNEKTGVTVELHWKTDRVETILVPGLFDWDAHVVRRGFQGGSLPMLDDPRHCLYLCLHAAKHHWTRLQWLLDIPMLMDRRKIGRDDLLALARRHGLQASVLESFCLSERLLGVDLGYARLDPRGKNARMASRRFRLSQESESHEEEPWTLVYHRGLLYPEVGPKLSYWLVWALGRLLNRLKKGWATVSWIRAFPRSRRATGPARRP